ncbi:hypothetical protein GCM10025876_24010 [Demequina litorisediminis]|uniref:Uncharacterized protein n=1 Tax=Demequina litorisediminis TaxID=1849022 RepID=A0ABQ6IGA7_9MICO|nr:hypothetical protein GCM10025876_24010 [Demequina litorisediminis]
MVSVSDLRIPTPGCCGNVYASGTPRMVRDSAAEKVRRPMRYDRNVSRPRRLAFLKSL